MSDSDDPQVRPSEQRGGSTPGAAEARHKGEWAAEAQDGVVPAELGGSDAPRELLDDDPELGSSVLGETTGSDSPATDDGIDSSGRGDRRRGGAGTGNRARPSRRRRGAAPGRPAVGRRRRRGVGLFPDSGVVAAAGLGPVNSEKDPGKRDKYPNRVTAAPPTAQIR
jgi:hypothetical protein